MPQRKDSDTFLHNAENKKDLIHLLVNYVQGHKGIIKLSLPITENEKTQLVSEGRITELEDRNYCEADTRMILEAEKFDAPAIVQAADTDVLMLMVHEFPIERFNQKW